MARGGTGACDGQTSPHCFGRAISALSVERYPSPRGPMEGETMDANTSSPLPRWHWARFSGGSCPMMMNTTTEDANHVRNKETGPLPQHTCGR